MLKSIIIRNLAVVEDVEVSFTDQMNVITGETGSGKSLLIDAIKLALGSRADKSLIRTGEKECFILAEFIFDNNFEINKILNDLNVSDTEDNCLIIKRTITHNSSRNQVNDEPVTIQTLRKIGKFIVDMHGPYDHQSLLEDNKQIEILDSFGSCKKTLLEYQNVYKEYSELKNMEKNFENESKDGINQEIEFLEFQINELNRLDLSVAEEEMIKNEHEVSANAHQVLMLSNEITEILNNGEDCAYDKLVASQNAVNKLGNLIPESKNWSNQINEAVNIILDTVSEIEKCIGSIDASSERLSWLDERLATYQNIKRKYKSSIDDILQKKKDWNKKLEYLKNIDENIIKIRKEIKQKFEILMDKGNKLSLERESSADNLSELITKELVDLGFENAFFDVKISKIEPFKLGINKVEFGFTPNAGEEMRDLKLVASSGEMSRVMLAVKNVLSKQDDIPILIFDEIDANIGGKIANSVGNKLQKISKNHQLICITHLPQVASFGSNHIFVSKSVVNGRTYSKMKVLDSNERPEEIARMLSGDKESKISIEHAKSLLVDES